jgi:hypothetical protein
MGPDAVAACTLSTLEGGGWRLPSLLELATLEDHSRIRVDTANGPHVDLRYFKDTFADYYVSSTHVGQAYWSFNFGKLDPDTMKSGDPVRVDVSQPVPGRATTGYVRCVRRSK